MCMDMMFYISFTTFYHVLTAIMIACQYFWALNTTIPAGFMFNKSKTTTEKL